jgi:hypothetical protein
LARARAQRGSRVTKDDAGSIGEGARDSDDEREKIEVESARKKAMSEMDLRTEAGDHSSHTSRAIHTITGQYISHDRSFISDNKRRYKKRDTLIRKNTLSQKIESGVGILEGLAVASHGRVGDLSDRLKPLKVSGLFLGVKDRLRP